MNAKSGSLVALGLFLGLLASAQFGENQSAAVAAHPLPNQAARYQLSAYAAPTAGGGFGHGCYVIDRMTGQLWHARQGGQSEKVGEPLAQ